MTQIEKLKLVVDMRLRLTNQGATAVESCILNANNESAAEEWNRLNDKITALFKITEAA